MRRGNILDAFTKKKKKNSRCIKAKQLELFLEECFLWRTSRGGREEEGRGVEVLVPTPSRA